MNRIVLQVGRFVGFALALLLAWVAPAAAQIDRITISKDAEFTQTGPTTVGEADYFFQATVSPATVAAGTMTYPGPGSPQAAENTPQCCVFLSPGFATQADLDSAYPAGAYTFMVSGVSLNDTQTLTFADAYPSAIPALTAASFNGLNNLDTTLSSWTVNFNAFTPLSPATTAFTDFYVSGPVNTLECTNLPPSATSCTFDPQGLGAGQMAFWELYYVDTINGFLPDGAQTQVQFLFVTFGEFTTASPVPEPSTWAMILLGFVGLGPVGSNRGKCFAQPRSGESSRLG